MDTTKFQSESLDNSRKRPADDETNDQPMAKKTNPGNEDNTESPVITENPGNDDNTEPPESTENPVATETTNASESVVAMETANTSESANISELEALRNRVRELESKQSKTEERLSKAEKRIQRNESHSRQRNICIWGLDKKKVLDAEGKERGTFKEIMVKGLKVSETRAKQILNYIDTMHFTPDNALIIAFARRDDLQYLRSRRANLKDFKIHGKSISFADDLVPEHQLIHKECVAKYKAMKAQPEKYKTVRMFSYNKIAANQEVKIYTDWE